MPKIEYEAIHDFVLAEIPAERQAFDEFGVPEVDERIVKAKIGTIVSVGNTVPDYIEVGETYIIDEYIGRRIPDPHRHLVLIKYQLLGLRRKEVE